MLKKLDFDEAFYALFRTALFNPKDKLYYKNLNEEIMKEASKGDESFYEFLKAAKERAEFEAEKYGEDNILQASRENIEKLLEVK